MKKTTARSNYTPEEMEDEEYVDLLESGLLVPHYLIHCFLYYECARPIISDRQFDELARRLRDEWDDVRHPHKKLIDRGALASGGSYLMRKLPMRVEMSALHLDASRASRRKAS